MLFNTPEFILFLGVTLLLFWICPKKVRRYYLLLINTIYIYSLGGFTSIAFVLGTTLLAQIVGWFSKEGKKKRAVCLVGVILVCCILFYGKYLPLVYDLVFGRELNSRFILSTVGLSYYSFSIISYLFDIMRNEDEVDDSFIDLLLWTTFFAKIVAGPIESHKTFREQLINVKDMRFCFERLKRALLIIAFGYFEKIIIADRLGVIVDSVYLNLEKYSGIILLLIMFAYSFQIYMDFAGYSNIALGIAMAMGFSITQNFRQPYLANSVKEFWGKWHISLSQWLKRYVYIPLGGNRKGKTRKWINILITFLVSGIWHGAGLNYVVWGLLHGCYQVIEDNSYIAKFNKTVLGKVKTFILVSFAWIFFRASGINQAFSFIRRMLIPYNFTDGIVNTVLLLGLDKYDLVVLCIAIIMIVVIDLLQNKKISLYNILMNQNIIIRWGYYYGIIVMLLLFGKYGPSFDANNFIYFKY